MRANIEKLTDDDIIKNLNDFLDGLDEFTMARIVKYSALLTYEAMIILQGNIIFILGPLQDYRQVLVSSIKAAGVNETCADLFNIIRSRNSGYSKEYLKSLYAALIYIFCVDVAVGIIVDDNIFVQSEFKLNPKKRDDIVGILVNCLTALADL